MFKRLGLFLLTNILVIAAASIVLRVLNVEHYVTPYGLNYQSLLVFCLVWGMVGSVISLLMSKFMAKMMMGVKTVDANDGRFGPLVRKVHMIAQSAGLRKMPEVGVYDSPELNAFATGPSKSNSLVAVSTGLLNHMNEEEVEGVLAHEVAHIANGDMVTMTLIQGVVNAFVMFFARIAAFAISNAMRGERDDNRSGGFVEFILVIVFQIFFGILASFVTSYFSRLREFRADAGAAKYSGRYKMIAALKKLQRGMNIVDPNVPESMQALQISARGSKLMALLSTHPPLEKRIEALERMS